MEKLVLPTDACPWNASLIYQGIPVHIVFFTNGTLAHLLSGKYALYTSFKGCMQKAGLE